MHAPSQPATNWWGVAGASRSLACSSAALLALLCWRAYTLSLEAHTAAKPAESFLGFHLAINNPYKKQKLALVLRKQVSCLFHCCSTAGAALLARLNPLPRSTHTSQSSWELFRFSPGCKSSRQKAKASIAFKKAGPLLPCLPVLVLLCWRA